VENRPLFFARVPRGRRGILRHAEHASFETRTKTSERNAVIAGLDPAIHPFRKMMDARVKPAHDDLELL
jgi:hypothetical protein